MKKKHDPKRLALEDRYAKACAAFERWYARSRRAFTAMDKAKKAAARARKALQRHEEEQTARKPARGATRPTGAANGEATPPEEPTPGKVRDQTGRSNLKPK